jgi:adenylylsulfate kinase-like enzyme
VTEALCILFTGRSGAGKDTVGRGVAHELRRRGRACALLDATSVERHLEPGTAAIVWCCDLLTANGVTALVTTPVSTRAVRERLRAELPQLREVFLDIPGNVGATRSGERDDGYEEPYAPDLRVPTYDRDAAASIAQVVSYLEAQGLAPHDPPHPSEQPPEGRP